MNRAFLIWLSKQAGEFESVEDSGGRVAGKWKDNAKVIDLCILNKLKV